MSLLRVYSKITWMLVLDEDHYYSFRLINEKETFHIRAAFSLKMIFDNNMVRIYKHHSAPFKNH